MIRKLDALTLKTADAIVLWLWNRFGVPYAQQMLFLTALLLFVAAYAFSESGTKYGLTFWITWPIATLIYSAVCLQRALIPPEAHNAMVLARRGLSIFRFCRWGIPGIGVVLAVGEGPAIGHLVFWSVWWLWNLWTDAMAPTKPRKRRRVTVRGAVPQGGAA